MNYNDFINNIDNIVEIQNKLFRFIKKSFSQYVHDSFSEKDMSMKIYNNKKIHFELAHFDVFTISSTSIYFEGEHGKTNITLFRYDNYEQLFKIIDSF